MRRIIIFQLHHLLRRACKGKVPPFSPPSGPEVDDPVGGFNDVHIVLDDDDRVALFYQRIDAVQQFADVVEVQTGGGFIENKEDMF